MNNNYPHFCMYNEPIFCHEYIFITLEVMVFLIHIVL